MKRSDFEAVLAQVREFVRREVIPQEDQIERGDRVPADLDAKARAMGLYGYAIPEKYDGLGLNAREVAELTFELGYTTPALKALAGGNNGAAGLAILEGGTEVQRMRYLPAFARGDLVGAFALTEENAGSDPSTLITSAKRVSDQFWVIDGSKRFVSNGPRADIIVVFARTGTVDEKAAGVSAFIVDAKSPGISVGLPYEKMGQRGALTADVVFNGVQVHHDQLLGGEKALGRGYRIALNSLMLSRLGVAAACVGMSQRLLDEAASYAAARTQGGRTIGSYQLVQALLADSKTELMAARALVLECADSLDRNSAPQVAAACAKYFCSEVVDRVADRAVQIFGGSGYIRGVPVERLYRDARVFRLYEGTSQIQQLIIGREVVRSATATDPPAGGHE